MASGYLIVTKFSVLYDTALRSGRYDDNPKTSSPIYGIPHRSRPVPPEGLPQYRGIDREPLQGLTYDYARLFTEAGFPREANEATVLLDEIESTTGRDDGWVTASEDIQRVWKALWESRSKYELIFAKEWHDRTEPPQNAQLLGSDAAYFVFDCFSCICDALFIPRWHGTDLEGILFQSYFSKLNPNGLFDTNGEAMDYLRYYLSLDWTERDENFTSIEVYALPDAAT
jgi:hypothetical protein